MIRRVREFAIVTLCLGVCGNPAGGQTAAPAILVIDVGNVVEYQGDAYDPSKFATDPNITRSAGARTFSANTVFGDIVAVNGQPAKGVYVANPKGIGLNTNLSPGMAIADTTHASLKSHTFEILKSDGTPVGTIMCSGLDGATPPPGAPDYSVDTRGNFTIFGGFRQQKLSSQEVQHLPIDHICLDKRKNRDRRRVSPQR